MLYIRDLNIIPQCEEFYSKIDVSKNLLSVKIGDLQAYNRNVAKTSNKSKSKGVKKNEATIRTSKTSKNRSVVVVKNEDQERLNRHAFRRPPLPLHHDGITSSGVGSDTMRQLEHMRDGSDSSPSQKKNRDKVKVSKNPNKKISRRIINEEESESNSNKRKNPHMKKVRTIMEKGRDERHDRLKKTSMRNKSNKIIESKRHSTLSKKIYITKKQQKHDDSDSVHDEEKMYKPKRRKSDDGEVKKQQPKRKKSNGSDDDEEKNSQPKRSRSNDKSKNAKKKKGK